MNWAGFKVLRRKIKESGCYGECNFTAGTVTIDSGLEGKDELDTLIHEGLHALDPDASEDHVTNTARLVADLLWRQGYRRKR